VTLAPTVGEPATRVGIDRAQQRLQRIEKADDEDACSQVLEILGGEAEPELLACAGQDQGHEHQPCIAPQRQEFRDGAPAAHDRSTLTFSRVIHFIVEVRPDCTQNDSHEAIAS
jgi:hypothetical protein